MQNTHNKTEGWKTRNLLALKSGAETSQTAKLAAANRIAPQPHLYAMQHT
jgi:hypothetical protein